jgi:hypothetical protein
VLPASFGHEAASGSQAQLLPFQLPPPALEGNMALDERSRHELYLKPEQVLGSDPASVLMEMLPPVGWADVATKRDIDGLAAATKRDIDGLATATKRDIDALAAATKTDISSLAAAVETLEHRLRAEFANQTRTIVLAMLGSSLAILATTLGAVFAMT